MGLSKETLPCSKLPSVLDMLRDRRRPLLLVQTPARLLHQAYSIATTRDGRCLKVLQIPRSGVTDKMVEKHAELLGNITVLDISYCLKITFKGVEAFGKHCKSLTHLKRNMPPPEWEEPALAEASKVNDTEATIIADTMTGLRHLELCFGCFGDNRLNSIPTKCKKLAYLGHPRSWNAEFKGDL
ncbi:F-box protein FBW2-like [Actinidia eriantha]|uniref:F-box protein FBW2-like n=1 Tax=Actinidia eriantha TaxID=165200 RepID=UPI00258D9AD8|nr:F-box protein FBW2-like [Actinidia eriantha]